MSKIEIFDGAEQKKIQGKLSDWSEDIVAEEIERFVKDKAQIYHSGNNIRFTEEAIDLLNDMKIRTKQVKDLDSPVEDGKTKRVCVLIEYGPDRGASIWALSYNPMQEKDRFNPDKTEVNCFDPQFCIDSVWERHDDGTKTYRLIEAKEMGYDSIQHANKGVFRELEEEFESYDYEGEFEEGE